MIELISSPVFHYLFTVIVALSFTGVLITILLENRNPAKSLAYIIVLVFFPVVGLVIYYFVGKDLRKKQIFKRKAFKDLQIAKEYVERYFLESRKELGSLEDRIGSLSQAFTLLLHQKQSLVHHGNRMTLLTNGEEKFPALTKALEGARHHIHIEYYIFSKDDVGEKITAILLQKLAAGVEVRLIVDDRGSNRIKDIPKRLREAGAEVYKFMPVRFSSLSQANYRNHRKIVVIDGIVGFVGGINLADRYLNNGKHRLFWRDTHLKIEGSAVKELQYHFFQSLSFVTKKKYSLRREYFPESPGYDTDSTICMAASGPASPFPYNMEVILSVIAQAKKSIKITNPYFIPSDQVVTALGIAASAGVEVEMIMPAHSDSFIVKHASFSYLKPLLARGVKIYLYEKGFVHAKTMIIDGVVGIIGTVNMDMRSFYINFEIAALFHDPGLCRRMSDHFVEDKANSTVIDPEMWLKRPLKERLPDSVCRLLTPLI